MGLIIICLVSSGFAGAALLMHFLTRRAWKTRQRTRLLVTEVEPRTDRDGDRFFKLHYLVLDGDHAGAKAVGTMKSNPPVHERHTHVEGWYNPADGTAISEKGAAWEQRVPPILLAVSLFVLVVGSVFFFLV